MANRIQKLNLFSFFFKLKKIHHFGRSKHSSISALPDLDGKKLSSTYWHIVVLLNLNFPLDKFKNNEEKAIIVFFAVLAFRVPFF
jgi:hypothetical protein